MVLGLNKIVNSITLSVIVLLIATNSWAIQVNNKAPEFNLPDIYGKTVSLNSLKGKVVYINFWASWCGPCKQEFPQLEKLAATYSGSGLFILAINQDKTRSGMVEFLDKNPISSSNMKVLTDPQFSVISSYGPRAMPTSFIIDKEGVVRYIHFGFSETDPSKWIKEIDSLIK
ncbi:MAG: TlpA family protein disulfide reductase [Nitrospirae bacterium]|nr:TlpA family protein disulfide reductase [Nitrospirota bacterium]